MIIPKAKTELGKNVHDTFGIPLERGLAFEKHTSEVIDKYTRTYLDCLIEHTDKPDMGIHKTADNQGLELTPWGIYNDLVSVAQNEAELAALSFVAIKTYEVVQSFVNQAIEYAEKKQIRKKVVN